MTAHSRPRCVILEADYCYGLGPLSLEIERIDLSLPVFYEGEVWYDVEGIEIGNDGLESRRRQVLVRASRLPASVLHRQ